MCYHSILVSNLNQNNKINNLETRTCGKKLIIHFKIIKVSY